MGNTNKFWTGVLLGALAGGMISLLDRDTRKAVTEGCGKTAKEISYCVTHPNEVIERIKDKADQLRSTVEQVSDDVTFIAEKVEELREVAPSVVGIVQDTKEAFFKDEDKA